MAATKKKIVETFSEVSGIGPAYAEQLYDEFGLRSLADLVAAGEDGKLVELKGVGPAKAKSITKSAQDMLSTSAPTKAPEKKKGGPKKSGAKKAPKKDGAKKAPANSPKKAATPEAKAKKEAPKKEEPKKEAPKKEAPKKESPKRNRSSDFEDRARASKSSPGKRPTIPGLLFKIGKKLVSRLLS
jgi:Holliday junction resolvasome RuvABC DNA-binding subunit